MTWINGLISLVLLLSFLVGCRPPSQERVSTPGVGMRIHDLQGCAHLSPYNGRLVEKIEGVVTKKTNSGFYLQDEQEDELECSSEGIFVHTGEYPVVLPGDKVQVSGRVKEYYPGSESDNNLPITEIELEKVALASRGNPLPDAIVIGIGGRKIPESIVEDDSFTSFDVDADGLDFFESLESMIVGVNSGIVVGPRNPYNEVVIIPQELLARNLVSHDGALMQTEEDLNPERIMLNMNSTNIAKVDVGSRLSKPVMGILDYSYGNYKINTFGLVEFENPGSERRTTNLPKGDLTIASYNVKNLSLDDERSKYVGIARNIVNDLKNPQVVILHEIMDDSGITDDGEVSASATISRLIDEIEGAGGPKYGYIDNPPKNNQDGGIEGGNIRSVMIYRQDQELRLVEAGLGKGMKSNPMRIGDDSGDFYGTRKPLVVLFATPNSKFLVIAAHLTSRGADSPIFGNVQPIEKTEEQKRNLQARYINHFAEEFLLKNPDSHVIISGDMNDDPWSNTIKELEGDHFTNMGRFLPSFEQYSYILNGNAIQLDYILVSDKVKITDDSFWISHINSLHDYTSQISDHDAVLAVIQVESD